MKRGAFVLIICLLSAIKLDVIAQIKPYLAIVNTGKAVFKGVLYDVTPDSIGIKGASSVVFFKSSSIKSIKIKTLKKGSKYRKYVNYDLSNDKSFEKVSNKMVPVRKWGEEDPTIEEELSCRIISSFYNAAINGVVASVNCLNGSLANVKVNHDSIKYQEQVATLTYHSILYQKSPESNVGLVGVKTTLASKEVN